MHDSQISRHSIRDSWVCPYQSLVISCSIFTPPRKATIFSPTLTPILLNSHSRPVDSILTPGQFVRFPLPGRWSDFSLPCHIPRFFPCHIQGKSLPFRQENEKPQKILPHTRPIHGGSSIPHR